MATGNIYHEDKFDFIRDAQARPMTAQSLLYSTVKFLRFSPFCYVVRTNGKSSRGGVIAFALYMCTEYHRQSYLV